MFQDPFITLMTMLLLCFMGILMMFLFFIRSLASQEKEIHEAFRKQQLHLADIERQLMDVTFALRKLSEKDDGASAGESPRVKTSQTDNENLTSLHQEDLMAMLEVAGRKKSGMPEFDDHLLPPPLASRPLVEEYDPARDPHLFEDALLPDPGYASPRSRFNKNKSTAGHGTPLSIRLDD